MIYLIDTIGNETGMNLYDKAFHDEFEKLDIEVKTLSNYEEGYSIKLFDNFYRGSKPTKVIKLFLAWIKVLLFRIKYHKEIFIYQSFGMRFIDMLFILLFINSDKCFVVVHDVFEITNNSKDGLKKKLQLLAYQRWINNVICHSEGAIGTLKENAGFTGNILFYPHFKYNFNKEFDENSIAQQVKQSISTDKINLLFFGQIRESKGIDILIDAIDHIGNNDKINFIIAGSDKGKILDGHSFPNNVNVITRYITDDELNYLFTYTQVVILPYKEIYQSGVLETVVYFKKYAILSDVEAFRNFLSQYPSFGRIYTPNTGESLSKCISEIVDVSETYTDSDVERYEKNHDIVLLRDQMEKVLDYKL